MNDQTLKTTGDLKTLRSYRKTKVKNWVCCMKKEKRIRRELDMTEMNGRWNYELRYNEPIKFLSFVNGKH